MRHLENELEWTNSSKLNNFATQFQGNKISLVDYKIHLDNSIYDLGNKAQLRNNVDGRFNKSRELHETFIDDVLLAPVEDCMPETKLGPENNVSLVASCLSALTSTIYKLLALQIDLDRGRAELRHIHALARSAIAAVTLKQRPDPGYKLRK